MDLPVIRCVLCGKELTAGPECPRCFGEIVLQQDGAVPGRLQSRLDAIKKKMWCSIVLFPWLLLPIAALDASELLYAYPDEIRRYPEFERSIRRTRSLAGFLAVGYWVVSIVLLLLKL